MIRQRIVQLRRENPGVLALAVVGMLALMWGTSKVLWWRFGMLDREGLEKVLQIGQTEKRVFRVIAEGRWEERNCQSDQSCEYFIEDPQNLLRWEGFWYIWFRSEDGVVVDFEIQKGPPVCL